MLDINLSKTWQTVLTKLSTETNSPSFKTWFQRSDLNAINGDQALIKLSSNFAISYVKKNFESPLKNYLSEELGFPIKKIDFKEQEKEVTRKKEVVANQPSLIDFEDKVPVIEQVKVKTFSTLNDRYTFDTFIVGNKNRLAHAAGLAVSKSPGISYNPLY